MNLSNEKQLVCWQCGASLSKQSLPLSRTSSCEQCSADLHVCKLCRFYNPKLRDFCNEPRAEAARLPDRANFCDYFTPKAGAWVATSSKQQEAKAKLEALFGALEKPEDK